MIASRQQHLWQLPADPSKGVQNQDVDLGPFHVSINSRGYLMHMRQIAAAIFLAIVCFSNCQFAVAQQSEFRTWTDNTGQYTVRAKLLQVIGDQVELQKSHGSTIRLPLARLSQQDRQFVEQQSTDPEAIMEPGDAKPVANSLVDLTTAREVVLEKHFDWQVKPSSLARRNPRDPQPLEIPYWDPETTTSSFRTNHFLGSKLSLMRNRSRDMWVMTEMQSQAYPDTKWKQGRATVIDWKSHEVLNSSFVLPAGPVMALSPSLQRLVIAEDPRSPLLNSWRIELWELSGDQFMGKSLIEIPFEEFSSSGDPRPYCEFVDENRMLFSAYKIPHRLAALCDFSTARIDWFVNADWNCVPCLSHDAQTLFVQKRGDIYAIDVATGRPIGTIKNRTKASGTLSISPDGSQLILVEAGYVIVFDLIQGRMVDSFSLSPLTFAWRPGQELEVEWLNDRRFICKWSEVSSSVTRFLIADLKHRQAVAIVWAPLVHLSGVDDSGRFHFFTLEHPNVFVGSLDLSDESIEQVIEDSVDNRLVFDKSQSMTLVCDFVCDTVLRYRHDGKFYRDVTRDVDYSERVRGHLETQFVAAGYQISADSEFVVSFIAKTPEQANKGYNRGLIPRDKKDHINGKPPSGAEYLNCWVRPKYGFTEYAKITQAGQMITNLHGAWHVDFAAYPNRLVPVIYPDETIDRRFENFVVLDFYARSLEFPYFTIDKSGIELTEFRDTQGNRIDVK